MIRQTPNGQHLFRSVPGMEVGEIHGALCGAAVPVGPEAERPQECPCVACRTEAAEPLACYSMGGRWSPNEDRPMHATDGGDRTLCGVQNIEAFVDGSPPRAIPFREIDHHRCARCERSYERRVRLGPVVPP